MTTSLLLVSPLDIGLATNRLTIRNFRRFQIHFRVVPLLHLRNNYLDVLLARARDQKFFSLRIAEEAQHGIFFHQLVDTRPQFVLVGPALGLNRESDGRLG